MNKLTRIEKAKRSVYLVLYRCLAWGSARWWWFAMWVHGWILNLKLTCEERSDPENFCPF